MPFVIQGKCVVARIDGPQYVSTLFTSIDMQTETNVQRAVPFFWVRDVETSVRFYVDGLGFATTKEWAPDGELRWCWLELEGAAIMLEEFWSEGPDRNVPEGPVGLGMCIYFMCHDALALYRTFRARGIETGRPFVGNGMWVVSLNDPDGYRLAFESPTNAPEETEYVDDSE